MLTYSKYSKALGVLFAISVLTTGSCGSKSESPDAGCQAGAEHCSCLTNSECNSGLVCATNLNQCVRLVTTGSGGDGTGSGGSGSGGSGSGGTTATGGNSGTGGSVATGGSSGSTGRGGTTGTGGTPGTGGSAGRGGTTGTGGTGTGGTSTTGGTTGTGGSATGGTPGTGGVTSTACTLTNHSGNGSFTYYYFGQGTAKDGSGYRTACGYYGTESGQVDTIQNIANMSPAKNTYFAAIPGQNGFDSKSHCGECVQITGQNGKQVIATIIDECPYGGDGNNSACAANANGHLDLSVDVFNQLGYSTGNPSGTNWKFVPCPVTGNVVARVKPGNPNELFLENSILNITAVAGASRTSYGTWHFGGNLSSGQSIQLTDEANRQLTIQLSSTSQGQNQDTGKQFPACQ
jgi:hypothetical protein